MTKPKITQTEAILMRRDGNTLTEARRRILDCHDQMQDCAFDPDLSEQILADCLGLELDYIFDVIWCSDKV